MVFIQIALPLPVRIVEPRIPCKHARGRHLIKNSSKDVVVVENVNTLGKTNRVNAVKYHAVHDAMLRVMTKGADGLTFAEIKSAALTHLSDPMFPGGDKLSWWVKSVQLDLEAKGDTKPLRFFLS
jgi:hypothetical protein